MGSTATISQVTLDWETAYATAFPYQILLGDSSRNLPLTGTITVNSAITDNTMD